MNSRRSFIASTTAAAAGAFFHFDVGRTLQPMLLPSVDGKKIESGDEPFWKLVRSQFPLTHDRIYLNNGTMGPSPYPVINACIKKMNYTDETGEYGGWDVARPKIARLIHCDEKEVSLTHNATEGIDIIASGLKLTRGDEVIMTTHEHVGNALPWLNRQKRDGIVVRTFVPARTAAENLNRVNDMITPKTRAIAMNVFSCTVGQLFPGKEIAKLGHDKNLFVMLDAAHPPGMMPVDVKDIGCDAYVSCGHKWLCGPKGTGFLYVDAKRFDDVTPIWVGGGSDKGWDFAGKLEYADTAHRYDFGTQNAALYEGLAASIDFMMNIGLENIHRRTKALATHLLTGLEELGDRVEILTPTEDQSRAAVAGFKLKNADMTKIAAHLGEKYHMRVRNVHEAGLNSTRISTHIYNSFEDVDLLLKGLKELA